MIMPIPLVHSNGTSKQDLVSYRHRSIQLIEDLMQLLRTNFPHMRDYYLYSKSAGKFDKAKYVHNERLNILYKLRDDLEFEIGEILAQV